MYEIDKINYLQIGVQGENIARKIEIDMTKWVEDLEADNVSGYSFGLIFKPYNDPNKYPMVTTYDEETHVLTWRVSAAATQVPGVGYTEVRAQEEESGLVKKTRIIPTAVEDSVSGNETEPPEPQEEWVTAVLNAGEEAVEANEAAQAAKTDAETARDAAQAAAGNFQDLNAFVTGLEAGSSPTVDVTHSEGGYYNLVFGIPKGDRGDPAPSEEVVPAVENWLDENLDPITANPPLDASLSLSNAAAPANLVGLMKNAMVDETGVTDMVFVSGYYTNKNVGEVVPSTPTSSSAYVCAIAPCKPGQIVYANVYGASNARAWAFLDIDRKVISRAQDNTSWDGRIPEAPEGTAYITLNNRTGSQYKPTGYFGRVGIYPGTLGEVLKQNIEQITPSVIKRNLLIGHIDVEKTVDGITIKGNPITGIKVYGIATADIQTRLFGDLSNILLENGKTYLMTASHTGTNEISSATWYPFLRGTVPNVSKVYMLTKEDGLLFSTSENEYYEPFIFVKNGCQLNMTLYPVLVEYKTEIDEQIKNASRKETNNIITTALLADDFEKNDIQVTNNHDGTMTIDGTNSSESAVALDVTNSYGIRLEANHIYLFSSNGEDPDIYPNENEYRMDIRKVGETSVVLSFEYAYGGIFIPSETALYRMFIRTAGSYSFSDLTIRPTLIDCTDKNIGVDNSSRIRIATYNVGNFNNGTSGHAAGNDAIYRGLINAFQKCDADMYMFCEWDTYWNYNDNVNSEDVLGSLKPYKSNWVWNRPTKWVMQIIYSDYPFVYERYGMFGDGHSRHYVDDVVLIKGKLVHFVCVHLHGTDLDSRYGDYDKIKEFLDSVGAEYYVIGGDFNHGYSGTVLSLQTARAEVNYMQTKTNSISVQGGFYGPLANDGFINTYSRGNDDDDVRPYDNFFVSKNIRIRNVFKVETAGSDHYPLCVDLEIM